MIGRDWSPVSRPLRPLEMTCLSRPSDRPSAQIHPKCFIHSGEAGPVFSTSRKTMAWSREGLKTFTLKGSRRFGLGCISPPEFQRRVHLVSTAKTESPTGTVGISIPKNRAGMNPGKRRG